MTRRPVIPLRNIVMYLIYPVQPEVTDSMVRLVLEVAVPEIQMGLWEIPDNSTNGTMEDTISQLMVCKCHKVLPHPKDTLAITTATGIMFTNSPWTPNSHGTNQSYPALEYQLQVELPPRDQNPHLRSSCNKLATLRQLSQILSTTHPIVAKWLHSKQQRRHHWRSRVH